MRHASFILPLAWLLAACNPAPSTLAPAAPVSVAVVLAATPATIVGLAEPVAALSQLSAPSPELAATSSAWNDMPILDPVPSPEVVETTTLTPSEAPAPSPTPLLAPARIVIDDIQMDQMLLSVGLDSSAMPIVPDHEAGWYNLSSMPGQGENVVLWGHALRFRNAPNIPAPFGRLKELQAGARITLYDANGVAHAYRVAEQIWATPDQVDYILPKGQELLTMVSCIGDKVQTENGVDMSHRLITIAQPEFT